jgi:hypothetical protein
MTRVTERPAYPPPQDDVKDAFVDWINEKRNDRYEVIAEPDKVQRNLPDIDYVLEDSATSHRIALEVSTVWRSAKAGKQDAYFTMWFDKVRAKVHGRVNGLYFLNLPLDVPKAWDADGFAEEFIQLVDLNSDKLTDSLKRGRTIELQIRGISLRVWKSAAEGSDITYARYAPPDPRGGLLQDLKRLLEDKAPKLKPYKDQGYETWIVAYSTAWPLYDPDDVRQMVLSLLGPDHAHVDHVGICSGNPPGGAWFVDVGPS